MTRRRPLYRHILVATDGSRVAARAVRTALALAAAVGARLHVVYVLAHPELVGAAAMHGARVVIQHLKQQGASRAAKALAAVARDAKSARVPFASEWVEDDRQLHVALDVARRRRCDLIVVAERGAGGLAALRAGGEAARLLSRSKAAVLIAR